MSVSILRLILIVLLVLPLCADDANPTVPLTVPPGTPLRLYLTHKIPKQTGTEVEAKVIEPNRSRDHTERMLASQGAEVWINDESVLLHPVQKLTPLDITVWIALIGILLVGIGRNLTGNLIPTKDPTLGLSLAHEQL